jgi:xanthine dehydrogenase accessory factor
MAEVGITSAADLARVHSPIGLDLGGRTPEETAISIVGEIIATRTGRQASPLSRSDGAIH